MECKHLEFGSCRVISILANSEFVTNAQICNACIGTDHPCDINNITVSMAMNHLIQLGNVSKAKELHSAHSDVLLATNKDIDLDCINRGSKIGYADCKCQGNTSIYSCDIYSECIKKRLSVDEPALVYFNGKSGSKHLMYCNQCEDILHSKTIVNDVYYGYINDDKLRQDIVKLYDLFKPTSLTVFNESSLYAAMLLQSMFGVCVRYKDTYITEYFDNSRHYIFADVLDKNGDCYDSIIKAAASNENKLISVYRLQNVDINTISVQIIAEDLCSWSLYQSKLLHYRSIGFMACAIDNKKFKYGPPVVMSMGHDMDVKCGKFFLVHTISGIVGLCAKYKLKILCIGSKDLYDILEMEPRDFDIVHVKD